MKEFTDDQLGFDLRNRGLDAVESHNALWMERARATARRLAREWGNVTADALRVAMGDDTPSHPNAWGAVWREQGWTPIGFQLSRTPSAHARRILEWRWDG